MFNIMRYINDTDFQIVYINQELNIINYERINYMEDKKISLSYQNKSVIIKGENLRVKKLLDNEIVVIGEIETIDFRK
jgi:sporulation protein YqfC